MATDPRRAESLAVSALRSTLRQNPLDRSPNADPAAMRIYQTNKAAMAALEWQCHIGRSEPGVTTKCHGATRKGTERALYLQLSDRNRNLDRLAAQH